MLVWGRAWRGVKRSGGRRGVQVLEHGTRVFGSELLGKREDVSKGILGLRGMRGRGKVRTFMLGGWERWIGGWDVGTIGRGLQNLMFGGQTPGELTPCSASPIFESSLGDFDYVR